MVLAVSRRAVSVVERLQHLRAQNVISTSNIEPSTLVELLLVRRNSALVPTEPFRPDAGQGLVVGVLAAGNELEAEIDVFLLCQHQAAEDEVAAVEAGYVAGSKAEGFGVIGGEVGQIGAGGGVRCEVGDCAVGGEDPAVFVGGEADWVVDVPLLGDLVFGLSFGRVLDEMRLLTLMRYS